jgi:uncharacterized protein YutE (UPF0331/DUF86 family)
VIALEACIDAGEHLIAGKLLRPPETYADVLASLGEAGIVDQADVPTLQAMARFRNLLIHGYATVDDRRVIEILRTRLGDFDAFRRQVARGR